MRRSGANTETGNYRFDLDRYVEPAAIGTGLVLGGAAVGAATGAIYSLHKPVDVKFARDVEGHVQLSTSLHGVDANASPFGLYAEDAPIESPLGVVKGIKIDFTRIGFDDSKSIGAIIAQPETAVGTPIKEAVKDQVIDFTLIGGIIIPLAVVGAYKAKKYVQRLMSDVNVLRKNVSENPSAEASEVIKRYDDKKEPGIIAKHWRKGVMTLAGFAIGLAGAHSIQQISKNENPPKGIPLKASIANKSIITKGALITGPNVKAIENIVNQSFNYIAEGTEFWKKSSNNFDVEYQRFLDDGGAEYIAEMKSDPNITTTMSIVSSACNKAYANNFFGNLVKTTSPDLVLLLGDVYSSANTSALENGCDTSLINQLGKIPYLAIRGNHDPLKWKLNALDKSNNFTKNINGINFVGAPDPTLSTWGKTKPEDAFKRFSLIGQQGSKVADVACDIYEKTGIKPVGLYHYKDSATESFLRNCISTAITGHGIENPLYPSLTSIKNIDGSTSYNQLVTTASGADGGITQEAKAKRPASTILHFMDMNTGQLAGGISGVIEENGNVKVSKLDLPKPKPITLKDRNFSLTHTADKNKLIARVK